MEDTDTAELLCTTNTDQCPFQTSQEAAAKPASQLTMFRRDMAQPAEATARACLALGETADQPCTLQHGCKADTRAS